MKHRYLEVTYSKGKPLAAYLYSENPIGIEITAPTLVTLDAIGAVLERAGQVRLLPDEWAPLNAT